MRNRGPPAQWDATLNLPIAAFPSASNRTDHYFNTLLDGILLLLAAFHTPPQLMHWMSLTIEGALNVATGIVVLLYPNLTTVAFLDIVGLWLMFSGVLRLTTAGRLRRELADEILLPVSEIATIVFGALIFVRPSINAIAGDWILAFYALVFGVLMLALSRQLRSWRGGAGRSMLART